MLHSFFLYGVYDEDQKCHSRFEPFIVKKERAKTQGTIYELQCGLVLMSSIGNLTISGHIVDLEIPDSYLAVLDVICGYDPLNPKKSFVLRQTINAIAGDLSFREVQTYCLNTDRKMAHFRGLDADMLSVYLGTQRKESLIDRLTERQKFYIHKLAQAKGREIVPIDMTVYRELMSLELIVDKGRRLALSRLGAEVSWFL